MILDSVLVRSSDVLHKKLSRVNAVHCPLLPSIALYSVVSTDSLVGVSLCELHEVLQVD
jgi:hypothetical protein